MADPTGREQTLSVPLLKWPALVTWNPKHSYWGSPGKTWHMFCLGHLWITWGSK